MNVASVQRYLRQIALPEIGPAGQDRLAAATVVVAGEAAGDLVAEVAARYLAAAGVGTLRLARGGAADAGDQTGHHTGDDDATIDDGLRGSNPDVALERAAWPADGAGWMELLDGADLVVRAGFDDDAMLRAAVRRGVPAVVARGDGDRAELISFRRHGPCPHAALDLPRGAPCPPSPPAAAVVAGTLAAAEAIHLLCGNGGDARARHLALPLDGGAPRAQEIPWAPECFACGGGATEMTFP
jgi:adenylyltransferase/sulfurtransferase